MKLSILNSVLLFINDLFVVKVILLFLVQCKALNRRKIQRLCVYSEKDPLEYAGIRMYYGLIDKNYSLIDHISVYITAVVIIPDKYKIKEKPYSRKYIFINESSADKSFVVIALILMLYKNRVGSDAFIEILSELEEFYGEELQVLVNYFRDGMRDGHFFDF